VICDKAAYNAILKEWVVDNYWAFDWALGELIPGCPIRGFKMDRSNAHAYIKLSDGVWKDLGYYKDGNMTTQQRTSIYNAIMIP
jgi:hypothetical protein